MQDYDVVIVGGGIAGLALACGLQANNWRIMVLEQEPPKLLETNILPVLRVSAINAISERLLTRLGVWEDIIASGISCYHGVEVWEKDGFGYILFENEIFSYNCLGHIVKNSAIRGALWRKVQQYTNITLVAPVHLQDVLWSENKVFIILKSGDTLTTKLVIGADGTNSWLRNKANILLTFLDYHHHALVATIRTAEAHGNIARQIFYKNGILAFLPLNDPHLCSIVWSMERKNAKEMQETDLKTFNQELCITFDNRLGLCSLESERQTFPLIGCHARQFASHRLVLIGDAAHTLHPLAGQGINIGLMDVAVLVQELLCLYRDGKDIGQHLYLRKYERSRKYSTIIMLASVHGLYKLFSGSHLIKKLLRNLGLRLANTTPGIKPYLLRQAMGLNNLPDWLR